MSQDPSLLYKLCAMVLTDVLPERLDAGYLFAQPGGILRTNQIKRGRELLAQVPILGLCGKIGEGYEGFAAWAGDLQEQGILSDRIMALPSPPDGVNTYSEAVELVMYAKTQGWKQLVITSTAHHQMRVFLTVLRQVELQYPELRVYNAPSAAIPWWKPVTHYQGEVTMTGHEFIDTELERIERYQLVGHIVSPAQGLEYLRARDSE